MPNYMTVARCDDPGCHCLDRAGVILYRGPDRVAAEAAKRDAPAGYAVDGPSAEGQQAAGHAGRRSRMSVSTLPDAFTATVRAGVAAVQTWQAGHTAELDQWSKRHLTGPGRRILTDGLRRNLSSESAYSLVARAVATGY